MDNLKHADIDEAVEWLQTLQPAPEGVEALLEELRIRREMARQSGPERAQHASDSRRFRCVCGLTHSWGGGQGVLVNWRPRCFILCDCGVEHSRG